VNACSRGPAKPEEGDGNTEAADAGWPEAKLWLYVAVIVEARFEVVLQVDEERWDDSQCADEEPEVRETFLAQAEVIDLDEDDNEAAPMLVVVRTMP